MTMPTADHLARRTLLGLPLQFLGAAALSSLMVGPSRAQNAAEAGATLDLGDPNEKGFNPRNAHHNAEVYARMNLGINGKTNYGWFKGRVFAVFGDDAVIEPLFDLEGFGANRMVRQPDGSYQSLHREVGYYKDLRSGQIMETWNNPYLDGERTEVFHINNDPVNAVIGPIVRAKLGEAQNVTEFPLFLPWTIMGDTAMTSSDVNLRWKNKLDPKAWPRESSGDFVRVSEYLQFYIPRTQLENWRDFDKIPKTGAWQRLANWLPWMLMGQRPGHLFYRAHTKSLASVEEMPRDILAYTEKNYPRYLEAPETWVEPNVSSFEVYARDRKPVPVRGG